MRAAFYTLGCKLNQYETESIADSFRKLGFEIVNYTDNADIFIVNTCTVTTKSEQKARRLIRKLSKDNSNSFIIVTGCYAQLEKEKIKNLGSNVIIVPQGSKTIIHSFAEIIKNNPDNYLILLNDELLGFYSDDKDKFSYSPDNYSFHSRAFVKIQDGCDYMCTYCRVPFARGKSVSMNYELLIRNIKNLEKKGFREVVLTGVNIASYKYNDVNFYTLLKKILNNTENIRIRISSLEPEKINEILIDIVKNKRICSHFHLPVQSGSDKILRLMKRRYNRAKILENVKFLRQAKPDAFISADVITGFPGETDDDFDLTLDLIEKCRFSSLHIFRFSRRPGTEAYKMKPYIPERIAKKRAGILSDKIKLLYVNYIRGCNTKAEVILEKKIDAELPVEHNTDVGVWTGFSDNYLRLHLINVPAELKQGQLIECRILNVDEYDNTEQKLVAEYVKTI